MSLKLVTPFILCLILNIFLHGNLLIGVLNVLILALILIFFEAFSAKKVSQIDPIYLFFLGVVPLFHQNPKHPLILFFAIGFILLLLIYTKLKFKLFLLPVIFFWILVAGFYAGEIITYPISFQSNLLVFNDNWINQAITGMQNEALYAPYPIRLLLFNGSVYLYVLASKIAELFTIKNLYNVLLLANLYPLVVGIALDIRSWEKRKRLFYLSLFGVALSIVSSRFIDNLNPFLLLSPFLIYFILLGFPSINKKIYLLLVILSLLIATSPV
ncbi:MAG: hypothetical protein Q7S88_01575 [Candidatus Daviesbacteria bacterium]|nr:hypothetical protein [Candidatus Daviesbacteria bacterium]